MLSSVIQQAGQGPGIPGVPQLVAKVDLAAQQASVGSTPLFAVPVGQGGMYYVSAYVVVTQAATTSSTMPSVVIGYTDKDTGLVTAFTSNSITSTSTGNAAGVNSFGVNAVGGAVINAKEGTNINYSTSGYVSSGATPMQYAVHIKLEYLGA